MTKIETLIGDYKSFCLDLFTRTKTAGIDIDDMPTTHLLYRTSTNEEYETLRDALKPFCERFVETLFNGRAVSILILQKPLRLDKTRTVAMIELPAPRPAHMYPGGLESIGVLVGKALPEFKQRYKNALTGIKKHGTYCEPAFITFENDKTVKFYDYPLEEIIRLQGWAYERPTLSHDTSQNQQAAIINSWQRFLHNVENWHELVKGHEPKAVGCGLVYELENPINRPNESFAIADMRELKVAEPHYHEELEIYFVLQGSGSIVIGGQEHELRGNMAIVIPSNTAHFTLPDSELVLAVVNNPAFKPEHYIVLTDSNSAVKFDKAQFDKLVTEA
jgi:predicted metalloenzyme YecM/mannose-6-phosphate isomerase-like protein (cupin superfamily)